MENRQYFIRHVCMRRARLRAVDQGDPAKIAGTLNYSGAIIDTAHTQPEGAAS
jgi:hypothetical protein